MKNHTIMFLKNKILDEIFIKLKDMKYCFFDILYTIFYFKNSFRQFQTLNWCLVGLKENFFFTAHLNPFKCVLS